MLSLIDRQPLVGVSVQDLHDHLNVVDTSQDSYLQSLLDAAQGYCERVSGLDFTKTIWALTLEHFNGNHLWGWRTEYRDYYPGHYLKHMEIPLPRGPVQAVNSIQYYDPGNTLQTLDPSSYVATTPSMMPGVIWPESYWPATAARPDAVRIEFVSGFTSLPSAAAQAVRLLVGQWYAVREDLAYGPSTASGAVGNAVGALLEQVGCGRYA